MTIRYPVTTELNYTSLVRQAEALIAGEPNLIANLSNLSAHVFHNLEQVNWAGFYLMDDADTLVLGPFQGQVACIRIPVGKGVCGTAVAENRTQLVDDVHAFPGHIACDGASNSELVVPIRVHDKVIGVLDIDSPVHGRFSERDAAGMEQLATMLGQHIERTTSQ